MPGGVEYFAKKWHRMKGQHPEAVIGLCGAGATSTVPYMDKDHHDVTEHDMVL